MKIVLSSSGLALLSGATLVSCFAPHVTMPTCSLWSLHSVPKTVVSPRLLRPYCRQSTVYPGVVMRQRADGEQRIFHRGIERMFRQARGTLRFCKFRGAAKVALLGVAAAATSQVLPHAAGAAEVVLPLASSAMDGTFLENLTNSGFFQAFSLVFVSEIGDKTFFIAALLAAKTSRLISFAGSVGALTVMTVLAVLLGLAFHSVPTVFASGLPLDDIVAAAAFLYFGVITLKDAYELPTDSNEGIEEEKAEAEESVKELGGKNSVWSLILQTFSLVFAAEFGDRSFLTTIALGAAQSPVGVATGAIAAHASATVMLGLSASYRQVEKGATAVVVNSYVVQLLFDTKIRQMRPSNLLGAHRHCLFLCNHGIAVTGGAYLSQFISEKVIGYIGGSLFVVFAVTTAIGLF